jgi:hypothetical protein
MKKFLSVVVLLVALVCWTQSVQSQVAIDYDNAAQITYVVASFEVGDLVITYDQNFKRTFYNKSIDLGVNVLDIGECYIPDSKYNVTQNAIGSITPILLYPLNTNRIQSNYKNSDQQYSETVFRNTPEGLSRVAVVPNGGEQSVNPNLKQMAYGDDW